MEQTTPQPTRPVMDVARPRPVAPAAVRPAAASVSAKPTTTQLPEPTAVSAEPVPAPKPAEHPVEEPAKPVQTPQALAVHKAPADEGEEKPAEQTVELPPQDDAAEAEEQAHQESTVSTGPHAPVGVIVVTVLAMILLCALATMIYFDTQK